MSLRTFDPRDTIAETPALALRVSYRGRSHPLLLKQEGHNPTGSVKDRTAAGLLVALDLIRPLVPGSVVVESTSGNLGLGLAHLLRQLDCEFIAVIDPKTLRTTREALIAAGARLHEVDVPDGHGGYLLTRLRAVQELCRADPDLRWTDQYSNPANPEVHRVTTGPEIARQGGPRLDAVYAAVSSGGTLAGISAHLRTLGRPIRVVAADSKGSLVTSDTAGERLIAGIGASRRSSFLHAGSYDHAHRVDAAHAVAACRMVLEDTGIMLGGSSGSVVQAYLADLAAGVPVRHALALCADNGSRYAATVYDDGWLDQHGIREDVEAVIARQRGRGLAFRTDT